MQSHRNTTNNSSAASSNIADVKAPYAITLIRLSGARKSGQIAELCMELPCLKGRVGWPLSNGVESLGASDGLEITTRARSSRSRATRSSAWRRRWKSLRKGLEIDGPGDISLRAPPSRSGWWRLIPPVGEPVGCIIHRSSSRCTTSSRC